MRVSLVKWLKETKPAVLNEYRQYMKGKLKVYKREYYRKKYSKRIPQQ